uniref:3'-5' exonuclease domain-containing protein n=1 Tax=Panagrolaimus sp. PS1159 TaxID=55785 RepID=A0AC35FDH3_9BILA
MEESNNSKLIRQFISTFKPNFVAVDAETCCFFKLPSNRAYDYIAFAFSNEYVFLWYRPKKRYLRGLFKFLNDYNVNVLHFGPGDNHYFMTGQNSTDLQPFMPDGTLLSLSKASIIITGMPLDKGCTMSQWSSSPKIIYNHYRELFDYLILDVLILFLIKAARERNRVWYLK